MTTHKIFTDDLIFPEYGTLKMLVWKIGNIYRWPISRTQYIEDTKSTSPKFKNIVTTISVKGIQDPDE